MFLWFNVREHPKAQQAVVLVKTSQNTGPQLKVSSDRLVEPVASLGKILSKTRITMVLISLRVCAGWSAALLFTNPEDRFSRVKAQILVV